MEIDWSDGTEKQERIPDMQEVQWRFLLAQDEAVCPNKDAVRGKLMEAIERDGQVLVYQQLCQQFHWPVDADLVARLDAANAKTLQELEAKIKDAEENLGENETREAFLARANFFVKIGDKAKAEEAIQKTVEKTVAHGQKLDLAFTLARVAIFHGDNALLAKALEKAQAMLETGGDWDRRNRYKVYKGISDLLKRDINEATKHFLDTLSAFSCIEVFEFPEFLQLALCCALTTLPRAELRKRVIESPEVAVNAPKFLLDIASALCKSEYGLFFPGLDAAVSAMKAHWLIAPHAMHICKELRIRAYSQLLESYRSVQLQNMAEAFGVSAELIDKELSRFVGSGRLNCKIDKVSGVVDTNRPDTRNAFYQSDIRSGDSLLNRLQKLSRLVVV